MKKFLTKIVLFFKKEHVAKYLLEVFAFWAVFYLLLCIATSEVVDNVFGTVIGFLLSSMILYSCKVVIGLLEDLLKINYDTQELLEIYSGDPNYKKTLTARDKTQVTFAYAHVLIADGGSYSVVDQPEKRFELDELIQGYYDHLFSAHSNSAKQNFDTIRLDRYDPATRTFHLSRSTYFNHLVTNRAVDFKLFQDISLRTIYEYGPRLTPLEQSKMSNHVGINALVFLSDGHLLIPQRRADSTISKNKITSSIAVMLNFPNETKHDPRSATITADYLLRDNIFKNLSDRVKLPADAIDEAQTDIVFLGMGQNIYEGGKPQFYYAVTLHNIDTATYFQKRNAFIEAQKKAGKKEVLDVDKCMYAARYDSFTYHKDQVTFQTFNEKGKEGSATTGYEMSYLCNLWHYEQYQKAAGRNADGA